MDCNQIRVRRHAVTFSSENDGRVFLCPLEDVRGEPLGVKCMVDVL
jgi:hypothetical protein